MLIDFITQEATTTPNTTIKQMVPTGSYNAELFKKLSPEMTARMQTQYP